MTSVGLSLRGTSSLSPVSLLKALFLEEALALFLWFDVEDKLAFGTERVSSRAFYWLKREESSHLDTLLRRFRGYLTPSAFPVPHGEVDVDESGCLNLREFILCMRKARHVTTRYSPRGRSHSMVTR